MEKKNIERPWKQALMDKNDEERVNKLFIETVLKRRTNK